ncbi:hypothetical protein LCGC14_1156890 [marine sediment metagenome]|uniref:Bacteriophage T5 Orf172 DNA-binding domain-containing protein n=1 Tax=marine sediment metagenome TaxID=412755 RepID=A0A0F9PZA7_9ZZZZ
MEAESHVYIMRCKDMPYYKLGQAEDVEKRLSAVQCGCPFKLEVVFWAQVGSPNKIETALHKKYQYQRMQGEWYLLPRKDYYEIVEHLIRNSLFHKDMQEELELAARQN